MSSLEVMQDSITAVEVLIVLLVLLLELVTKLEVIIFSLDPEVVFQQRHLIKL
jgi:hypothetical protein